MTIEFDLETVKRLAAKGLTRDQIAASLGCHRRTVQRHITEDEGFAEAVAAGQAELCIELSDILVSAAKDGSIDAAKFILDRRLGWSKSVKQDIAVSGPSLNLVLQGMPEVS